jgi:hypothetical protein
VVRTTPVAGIEPPALGVYCPPARAVYTLSPEVRPGLTFHRTRSRGSVQQSFCVGAAPQKLSFVLWGKNLYDHLRDVYQEKSKFTVMFVSQHYARKMWTNRERQSAQARAFSENQDYILPARFDDTEVPGLLPTIGYIDLRNTSPIELAKLIEQKVKESSYIARENVHQRVESLPWDFREKFLQLTADIVKYIPGFPVTCFQIFFEPWKVFAKNELDNLSCPSPVFYLFSYITGGFLIVFKESSNSGAGAFHAF